MAYTITTNSFQTPPYSRVTRPLRDRQKIPDTQSKNRYQLLRGGHGIATGDRPSWPPHCRRTKTLQSTACAPNTRPSQITIYNVSALAGRSVVVFDFNSERQKPTLSRESGERTDARHEFKVNTLTLSSQHLASNSRGNLGLFPPSHLKLCSLIRLAIGLAKRFVGLEARTKTTAAEAWSKHTREVRFTDVTSFKKGT